MVQEKKNNFNLSLSKSDHIQELPQNLEAEQNILGLILYDNENFDKVSDILQKKTFFNPFHQKIYQAIEKLISRGQLASPITLKNIIEEDNKIDEKDLSYLHELVDGISNFNAIESFAYSVNDSYTRRQLIKIGETLVIDANINDLDKPSDKQIELAESELYNLAEKGNQELGPRDFSNVLTSTVNQIEKAIKTKGELSGVDTGFDTLNKKLGGLHPSDLIILAGRPSMGKTALATNIAFNAAAPIKNIQKPNPVLFFSLEMSSEQLASRIISSKSEISSDNLRRGINIDENAFKKIVKVNHEIYKAPFFIDETPSISIAQIATRSRRLKRQLNGNLGLIVVDYIQLISSQGSYRSEENRVTEVSKISRGLKSIAKDLNVPVLALSQLSRAVEQREDKKPNLSDLRESGSIEQDADLVLFVFREEYYWNKTEPSKKFDESSEKYDERYTNWVNKGKEIRGKAEVIIAKNRHGPVGKADMYFKDSYTKFSDLISDNYVPEEN